MRAQLLDSIGTPHSVRPVLSLSLEIWQALLQTLPLLPNIEYPVFNSDFFMVVVVMIKII